MGPALGGLRRSVMRPREMSSSHSPRPEAHLLAPHRWTPEASQPVLPGPFPKEQKGYRVQGVSGAQGTQDSPSASRTAVWERDPFLYGSWQPHITQAPGGSPRGFRDPQGSLPGQGSDRADGTAQ